MLSALTNKCDSNHITKTLLVHMEDSLRKLHNTCLQQEESVRVLSFSSFALHYLGSHGQFLDLREKVIVQEDILLENQLPPVPSPLGTEM
jgi:hypothetical protein